MELLSEKIFAVILTALAPTAELRVAIPLGFTQGLDPLTVVLVAVIANCVVFFPGFFLADLVSTKILSNRRRTSRFFERSRKPGMSLINKYGFVGLAIFVAMPLPFSGAWTGAILARLLGLEWKRSFLSVSIGIVIAALLVSFLTASFLRLSGFGF
ncbi:MAG: COG2426 family protein [Candidatus Bathyarchaeia archaeon]